MIQINSKWGISKDQRNWTTHETYEGVSKKKGSEGQVVQRVREAYHGSLTQAGVYIAEQDCVGASDLLEVVEAYESAKSALRGSLAASEGVPAWGRIASALGGS